MPTVPLPQEPWLVGRGDAQDSTRDPLHVVGLLRWHPYQRQAPRSKAREGEKCARVRFLSRSSGNGRRLMSGRSGVWIHSPYTGWTWHFHIDLLLKLNYLLEKAKNKLERGWGWSIFKIPLQNFKSSTLRAVVVAQLVEQLLPIPEVCGSNPDISKKLHWTFTVNCIWKDENKEKESGNGAFFKILYPLLSPPTSSPCPKPYLMHTCAKLGPSIYISNGRGKEAYYDILTN